MIADAAARARLVDALGLGPSWVRRDGVERRTTSNADVDRIPHVPIDRDRLIASMEWLPLQALVRGCLACPLSETRTHAVFGAGAEQPAWLVIGGGPRESDDEAGAPFTGPAGRLLDAILSSVGLSRTRDVFVTDVVKCRPPDDRAPSSLEATCCRPYLDRQIALLAPTLVVAVGERATQALFGADATIDAMRGRVHRLDVASGDLPVVVTDDPTDLLADPMRKARVWADLCVARTAYEEATATA